MEVTATAIPDVKLIKPKKHGDHRGFFSETYNHKNFVEALGDIKFVQDNHSLSATRGTIRGLHFQEPPFAQAKLIRVLKGSIWDVAVDIRKDSPTFGQHIGTVLSADNWEQLFVPAGFAHGFCTLEPDTEVLYKVDNYYAPQCDKGILWDDPELGLEWPISKDEAVLSDKDLKQPKFSDVRDVLPF